MGPSLSAARREASLSSCDCEPALERAVVGLYRNHFEGLFRFAMTITRDRALAEDAIQDSFLRYFVACREGQIIRSAVAARGVFENRLPVAGAFGQLHATANPCFEDPRASPGSR